MDENAFEGSVVLEKLAECGLVEDFYQAVDDDNLSKAISLMRRAQIGEDVIRMVIEKIKVDQL